MLALGALCVFLPVADAAASGSDVIDDCTQHGTLTKRYSQKEYRQALASLPADVDEYGDCRNIIKDAQVAGAATAGGSKKGTGAGTAPANFNQPPSGPTAGGPDENAALVDATRNGGGAVQVGKDAIAPGAQNSSFTESLPTPVLGVLALLGVGALAVGALALRRKLRGER
jgi:hypothetical protein